MYCPKCSQSSDEAQFCSQCGSQLESERLLTATESKTETPETEKLEGKLSPRQKGVRQGVKLMLLSIVLIPAYILLSALFPAHDVLVESHVSDTAFEKISEAVLFTIFMCGLARVLYAYFFERGSDDNEQETAQISASSSRYALPPSHSIPVSGFGAWRKNTGDVAQPVNAERDNEFPEKE